MTVYWVYNATKSQTHCIEPRNVYCKLFTYNIKMSIIVNYLIMLIKHSFVYCVKLLCYYCLNFLFYLTWKWVRGFYWFYNCVFKDVLSFLMLHASYYFVPRCTPRGNKNNLFDCSASNFPNCISYIKWLVMNLLLFLWKSSAFPIFQIQFFFYLTTSFNFFLTSTST